MSRALIVATWLLAGQAMAADLAIVVDDLGYNLGRAERVLALPAPVTLALLPFAPATGDIVRRSRDTGHDTILHQPMESLAAGHALPTSTSIPAPVPALGTLTVDMTAEHFEAQMDAALAAVPGIIGVNNHTGSRLTQDPAAMRRLMSYLAGRDLLFLDSRTTAATVAYRMAREAHVPALERDVFLDHVPHPQAIEAEFARALIIARRQGHAVVIAHPYPASLAFLEAALADLPAEVRLVSLRSLTERHHPATLAQQQSPGSPHRSLGQ